MSDAFHKYTRFSIAGFLAIMLLSAAHYKKRKPNSITIQGAALANQEVKSMVAYYVQYWQLEGLHLFIQFTPELPKGFYGYTQYSENKSLKIKQVVVRISTKQLQRQQWLTLAHEMIHVKQFSKGELIYHGGSAYSWKKHYYKDVRKIAYKKREWEKEAFSLESTMLKKYHQSQKLVAKR